MIQGFSTADLERLREQIDEELERRRRRDDRVGSRKAPPSIRRGTDTPPRDKTDPQA